MATVQLAAAKELAGAQQVLAAHALAACKEIELAVRAYRNLRWPQAKSMWPKAKRRSWPQAKSEFAAKELAAYKELAASQHTLTASKELRVCPGEWCAGS